MSNSDRSCVRQWSMMEKNSARKRPRECGTAVRQGDIYLLFILSFFREGDIYLFYLFKEDDIYLLFILFCIFVVVREGNI